jgi:hypothetical protein
MKRDKKSHKDLSSAAGEKEIQKQIALDKEENTSPDYPNYPANEDIYNQDKEEGLAPDETSRIKKPHKRSGKRNEKSFLEDVSGSDLDVPGSELDDVQENNGSEDEENNYYSLGGDDHNDLDEDKVE